MENVKVIYFSPTGGTKKVAMALASAWNEVEEIDLSVYGKDFSAIKLLEDDVVIFAMPSFSGRAPKIGMDRMMQIKGNGAKAIIAVGFGARDYDDTLLEMKNACLENGFQVIAAVAGVTEHSLARNVAAGRPNKDDQKELREFAGKVKQDVEDRKAFEDVKVKGQVPYKKVSNNPVKPKGNKNCIACGTCAKNCPVQAIPLDKPRSVDPKICINCGRCVNICPVHARGMGAAFDKSIEAALKIKCDSEKANELIFG